VNFTFRWIGAGGLAAGLSRLWPALAVRRRPRGSGPQKLHLGPKKIDMLYTSSPWEMFIGPQVTSWASESRAQVSCAAGGGALPAGCLAQNLSAIQLAFFAGSACPQPEPNQDDRATIELSDRPVAIG
jgi:hypothetical protein